VNDNEFVVIFITASSENESEKLGEILLAGHRVACVNVVEGVKSTYWWQGKLESARESLLIIKTRKSQVDAIIKIIKEKHSYTTPEILVIPVIGGNPDYLDWIASEVPEQEGGIIC
jgi:periplasmic divalent cation tolerance protein